MHRPLYFSIFLSTPNPIYFLSSSLHFPFFHFFYLHKSNTFLFPPLSFFLFPNNLFQYSFSSSSVESCAFCTQKNITTERKTALIDLKTEMEGNDGLQRFAGVCRLAVCGTTLDLNKHAKRLLPSPANARKSWQGVISLHSVSRSIRATFFFCVHTQKR